jgi:hypothetical protein
LLTPVLEAGRIGPSGRRELAVVLLHQDNAVRIAEGQRAKQEVVRGSENDCLSADAKRQGDDRDGGIARGFPQQAKSKAHILKKRLHEKKSGTVARIRLPEA